MLGRWVNLIFKCYVHLYCHAFFHYLMKFPVFCKIIGGGDLIDLFI